MVIPEKGANPEKKGIFLPMKLEKTLEENLVFILQEFWENVL